MTFGIKAGAQLTRSFSFDGGSITADAGAETNYIRPIIGLVFEKRLSPTISIQVDALYNREKFRYQQQCVCNARRRMHRSQYRLGNPPAILWSFLSCSRSIGIATIEDRYFANAGISFAV
jgi:hypothetical protein